MHFVIIDETIRVVSETSINDLPGEILVEEVAIAVKNNNTDNTHAQSENESTKRSVGVLCCGILAERMIGIVSFELL